MSITANMVAHDLDVKDVGNVINHDSLNDTEKMLDGSAEGILGWRYVRQMRRQYRRPERSERLEWPE